MRTLPLLGAAALPALAAACAGASSEDDAVVQERRILNGVGPDHFWNALTANPRALELMRELPLDALDDEPYFQEQLLDPAARRVLGKMIACALPEGEWWSVPRAHGYGRWWFGGQAGLAAKWRSTPMEEEARRRISACTLATVNAYALTVEIDLRGEPPDLFASSPDDRDRFWVEEASFYGDLFVTAAGWDDGVVVEQGRRFERGRAPELLFPEMFACHDPHYVAGEAYVQGRVCGFETCVARPVGPCPSVCVHDDGPAEPGDGDNELCHDGGRVHDQVVTVFLDDPCALRPEQGGCEWEP